MDYVKKQRQNFISLSELGNGPLEFKPALMFRRNLVFPLTDRNERSPIVRNKYRLSYKLLIHQFSSSYVKINVYPGDALQTFYLSASDDNVYLASFGRNTRWPAKISIPFHSPFKRVTMGDLRKKVSHKLTYNTSSHRAKLLYLQQKNYNE